MFEKRVFDGKVKYIWMDGQLVPREEAKLHVETECVMRGANVFEGLRAYWNDSLRDLFIFRIQDHMDRLFDTSMKLMRMTLPYTKKDLIGATCELIKANQLREDIHMRPTVYFGMGKNFGFRPEDIFTGAFITAQPLAVRSTLQKGLKCCVSSWVRISDRSVPPRIKSGANYQNNRLALYEALLNGYDNTIILTEGGKVSEGHGSNIFIVRDGVAITPPLTQDILEGITRKTLLELFPKEMGVTVLEREIDRTELYVADEVFLCGSNMEITPVVSIDHYPVGKGEQGPLTQRIQEVYFRAAKGIDEKYKPWLTPVYNT
jgi:branched-chain amino acid aminotransferase